MLVPILVLHLVVRPSWRDPYWARDRHVRPMDLWTGMHFTTVMLIKKQDEEAFLQLEQSKKYRVGNKTWVAPSPLEQQQRGGIQTIQMI